MLGFDSASAARSTAVFASRIASPSRSLMGCAGGDAKNRAASSFTAASAAISPPSSPPTPSATAISSRPSDSRTM
jgi:hypothetical protein